MDNKEIEALMKIMAFDASKQYEPWLHKPKDFGAKTTLRLRVRVPQTGRLSSPVRLVVDILDDRVIDLDVVSEKARAF